jgi:hypothetical protein
VVTDPTSGVEVVYVTSAPDTTDLINDPVWEDVDPEFIRVGEDEAYTDHFGLGIVRTKAVSDGEYVYFWFSWSDSTKSDRPAYWTYYDSGKVWRQNVDSTGFEVTNALNPRWANEDQLTLIWDNGSNGTEGANCALMCHNEDTMIVGGGGVVDVWIWRAGRTAPNRLADDMLWGTDRQYDDFSQNRASWERNAVDPNSDLTEPAYMHLDSPDFNGTYLFEDSAIAMDFGSIRWQTGEGVPGYVIERDLQPSQEAQTSRYDVGADSEYDHQLATWTVVLWRKLDTTNEDDFAFEQEQSYSATLAIMDHTDNFHSGSKVFTITF